MKTQVGLRLTAAFFIVAFFLLYLAAQKQAEDKERLAAPSVFNEDASGISVFKELAGRLKPGALTVSEDAILENGALNGQNTVMLFSPSAEISKREAKLLYDFAEGGKTLIVSFQDEYVWNESLKELTDLLKPPMTLDKIPGFKNGKAVTIQAPVDVGPYRKGETYSFYSSQKFKDDTCKQNEFFCYVKAVTVGTGQVLLIAGFPPVSNGLIERFDNGNVAFRLLDDVPHLYIDEYHHFFSSKTLSDLLTYPPFIVPVAGLVFGLLMYFIFAHTKFYERTLKGGEKVQVKSYHALSGSILDNMMTAPGLLHEVFAKQVEFLDNLFPERKEELRGVINQMNSKGIVEPHKRISELTRFHKSVLRQKGKRA